MNDRGRELSLSRESRQYIELRHIELRPSIVKLFFRALIRLAPHSMPICPRDFIQGRFHGDLTRKGIEARHAELVWMALTVLEVDRLLRHESDLLGVFQFLGSVQLRQWPLNRKWPSCSTFSQTRKSVIKVRCRAPELARTVHRWLVEPSNHRCPVYRRPGSSILLKGWQEVLRETLKKSEKP